MYYWIDNQVQLKSMIYLVCKDEKKTKLQQGVYPSIIGYNKSLSYTYSFIHKKRY